MEQTDYKVNVENFYGPLDLLLHLVKESEVDITRISLARVAEQYIAYLQAMQKLDMNLAGEFLVVASHLMLIKSRSLLPPEETEEEEEEEDASLDLIRKLLEYRQYKNFAATLGRMAEARALRFERPLPDDALRKTGEPDGEPLRDMELWDLVLSYSRISRQTLLDVSMSILYQDIPIEQFIQKILKTLEEKSRALFTELVGDPGDKSKVIGTFLALLELAKEQKIVVQQAVPRGEITIEIAPNPAAAPPVPTSPAPGGQP